MIERILKAIVGETTLTQDYFIIFATVTLFFAWFALYTGKDHNNNALGWRIIFPIWILDVSRHYNSTKKPRWYGAPIMAVLFAASLYNALVIETITNQPFLGFTTTMWWKIPTPIVLHKFPQATIAYYTITYYLSNTICGAISARIFANNWLATLTRQAIAMIAAYDKEIAPLTAAKIKQVSTNKIEVRYRAPVTYSKIAKLKFNLQPATNMWVESIHEVEPGRVEIAFQIQKPKDIINYEHTAPKQDFVYFIRYKLGDMNAVKIGRSNSPDNTLKACRRFIPEAKLVGALPYSENISEAIMHKRFKHERLERSPGDKSEVFALSPNIEKFLKQTFKS